MANISVYFRSNKRGYESLILSFNPEFFSEN